MCSFLKEHEKSQALFQFADKRRGDPAFEAQEFVTVNKCYR